MEEYSQIGSIKENIDGEESDWEEERNKIKGKKENRKHMSNMSRKKIPPRSKLQFKVGPPLEHHRTSPYIVTASNGKPVCFNLEARIDRGFDLISEQWVGYKRNYFNLVVAFQTNCHRINKFVEDTYTLNLRHGNKSHSLNISQFGVKLVSKVYQHEDEVGLVQHTAKRDKGPHGKPKFIPLVPSKLPDHESVKAITNLKRTKKGSSLERLFYYHSDNENIKEDSSKSINQIINNYPCNHICKVARFERIQFASSSGMRNIDGTFKSFQLYVILGATIKAPSKLNLGKLPFIDLLEDSKNGNSTYFIHLIQNTTPSLVIRGRSPSNYTDDGNPIPNTRKITEMANRNNTKVKSHHTDSTQTHNKTTLKRKHKNSIKNQVELTSIKKPRKILVKCSYKSPKTSTFKEILNFSKETESVGASLSCVNFLEESSPLKPSFSPPRTNELNVFKSTPKLNRSKITSKESNENKNVTDLNTSISFTNPILSSPIKLRSPNKIPSFMRRSKTDRPHSSIRNTEHLVTIKTLEALENEISERRHLLMNNNDNSGLNFKLVDSPDKKSSKSVNFKDIETNVSGKPRPENIVLLGSVLYSSIHSVYNNSRFNHYQNYVEDTSPKFNRSYLRQEINSASSELNTNELSATNITFSHLYNDKLKVLQSTNQNGKSDPTKFTSDDDILNYIIEQKEKLGSYNYSREPTLGFIQDSEPRTRLGILSSASDNILTDLQNSEGMRNDSKQEEGTSLQS